MIAATNHPERIGPAPQRCPASLRHCPGKIVGVYFGYMLFGNERKCLPI